MPRTNFRKTNLGNYSKCLICDYELKNNKKGIALHFKYSHPEEIFISGEKDRIRCSVCKQENCLLH